MRSCHVHITAAAERDLNRAADHIEFSLKNPQAADKLITEAEESLSGLSHMPERFALVDDKLLSAWGIRFVQVKNHLAFYTVPQMSDIVYVLRFLYGKSDWASILRSSMASE